MPIIIRNKNKYIYLTKSKIRSYLHYRPSLLEQYFELKAVFIKGMEGVKQPEGGLFKKIYLETISYCNNDCSFCPASKDKGAKDPCNFMKEGLYFKILKELKDLHFEGTVAFHCNNEPLLDSRLVSWIGMARDLLRPNFFYLYTNGILIDVDLVNQLFEAGLNRIIVNNYTESYELLPSVRNLIDNFKALHGEIIVNYRLKNEYLGNRAGESPNARGFLKRPLKVMCIRPLIEIAVGYNGTVPLCCADALWRVKAGDVTQSGLKDIWFSGLFKKIRSSLAKGDRSCTEICKLCDTLKLPRLKGI